MIQNGRGKTGSSAGESKLQLKIKIYGGGLTPSGDNPKVQLENQ
jgi:hypothetical protein